MYSTLESETVAGAIEGLTRRGFTEVFRVADGGLRAISAGKTLGADDLMIREFHRVEGVSDPDDMAIVDAVESKGGIRGTVTDAFGVCADPAITAVLSRVPFRTGALSVNKTRWRRRVSELH